MNSINLIGRLTKDPEISYTKNKGMAVARFSIAVDRVRKDSDGNKITDFIPVICFGKSAEYVGNYITKGYLIGVQGELHIDLYDDKEGNRKSYTNVVASSVQGLKKVGDNKGMPAPEEYTAVEGDEDLPF